MSIYSKYIKLIKSGKFTEIDVRYFRKAVNGCSSLSPVDREYLRLELDDAIAKRGGIKLTKEQTDKGINWLRGTAFKLNGSPRKSSPFGELENHIIKNFKRFEFVGLFNLSDKHFDNYMPIYRVIAKHGLYFDYMAGSFGQVIIVECGTIENRKPRIHTCRTWPSFQSRAELLERI